MSDNTCKRCAAYASLIKALEYQLEYHRANAVIYREAVETLQSERDANARLTGELDTNNKKLKLIQEITRNI